MMRMMKNYGSQLAPHGTLSRLEILSPISGGRLIELTARSPCLQRYLYALPNGEYVGKGYRVVATDGSLRLNRSSTKEPAMGPGCHDCGSCKPTWGADGEVHMNFAHRTTRVPWMRYSRRRGRRWLIWGTPSRRKWKKMAFAENKLW